MIKECQKMKRNQKRVSLFCAVGAVSLSTISAIQHIIFYKANKTEIPQVPPKRVYQYKNNFVAYQVYGSGRPLLLLHNTEIGASGAEWQNNIESLSRMYQVFVPDLPGFGDSQKPKITYTAYQYALFINDFIENVMQRSAFVVASSTAADFAVMAYALKHENIRKLVLISPTGLPKTTEKENNKKLFCHSILGNHFFVTADSKKANKIPSKKENYKRMLYQCPILGTQFFIQAASKKAIKKRLTQDFFFSKELVTKELVQNYYIMAHKGNENARFVFASADTQFLYADIQKVLKEMKIPLCVIWGKENHVNPPEQMEQIEQLKGDGSYILFENTRMLPHYENSTVFNETIHDFLQ